LIIRKFSLKASNGKPRVLSGIQPTGTLHLGNYLGALRQWVTNQDNYDNFFCVVDLHAVTAPHDPKQLEQETLKAVALYLAAGLDPTKCTIFVQSHVSAHAELAWLLNCTTPIGWLEVRPH
jgi:tryptophanyl-tRNA synthetase